MWHFVKTHPLEVQSMVTILEVAIVMDIFMGLHWHIQMFFLTKSGDLFTMSQITWKCRQAAGGRGIAGPALYTHHVKTQRRSLVNEIRHHLVLIKASNHIRMYPKAPKPYSIPQHHIVGDRWSRKKYNWGTEFVSYFLSGIWTKLYYRLPIAFRTITERTPIP